MASTNFLVFDEGKQNMMSDGDYSANTQRARGVTPGIAYPNLHNKLYYQVSVMAKAIADFMVAQGANASDEDVEQLTADISTAFTNFVDNKTKDVYLPLSGGTMKGNINANGYNITATKFIGNLQGKADSAANADLAAKATTAENANNSSVANKLGTSTVGSATKPVYINNGVASAVSVDLSILAPKASPGLTGTPTAPTAAVDTNNTQIATCGFVRNAIAKYAPMLDTMKKIYPVGSIYMSTVSTNPATLFGFGTWEAMPAGRVLLAQGKSDWGTTYEAGSSGGEATHQLTVGELPSHGHSASTNTANLTGNANSIGINYDEVSVSGIISKNRGNDYGGTNNDHNKTGFLINASHSHTVTINNTGSNQAHNNLQPYIAVYIWKRTA
ncbi:phage tail protein [Megamonas funiformis]|uniref:phage tail protein n=1 Tax=Megamonas funiformis TaxID=437897 RepID=UPI003F7D366B